MADEDLIPSLGDLFGNPDVIRPIVPTRSSLGVRSIGMGAVPFPQRQLSLPGADLPHLRALRAYTRPYRSDYRGEMQSRYNPDYFNVEEDVLRDEAGTPLAVKDRLLPKPGVTVNTIAAEKDPGLMYRGMSAGEYNDIINRGTIKSKGDWNIGSQEQGTTLFGSDPGTAEYYANSFAPPGFKPTWDRPAFVLGVKRQPPERIRKVEGNPGDYIPVEGEIPAEDITNIWRGNVIARTEPFESPGYKSGARSSLLWEALPLLRKLWSP